MDFLIGLSQGLTGGILNKQREESAKFDKLQDRIIEQLHNDVRLIRLEDYPKMMEHIHNITVAKNDKQLNEAYGRYKSSGIAEDYEKEQQAREYNNNIPTTSINEGGMMEGLGGGVNPQIGGQMAPGAPVRFNDFEEAIPISQQQVRMDPSSYAQDKIRFRTLEGDQDRAVRMAEEKGRIQTDVAVARETARGREKLKELQEKAKTAGLKGVKYVYDANNKLVQIGVDSAGNAVQNNLGDLQLPQSLIAEANNAARKEIAEDKLKQQQKQFDATLKLNRERLANAKRATELRFKEFDTKLRSGYYTKSGSAASANVRSMISVAKIKTDGIDRRYAIIEKEIQDIREMQKYDPDNPKFDDLINGKHLQMRGLADERDEIMQKLEEGIAIVDSYEPTADSGNARGSSPKGANKKPTLKVGDVRAALGLGGK